MLSAGAAATAMSMDPRSANVSVNAIGENIFPSMFCSVNIGRKTMMIMAIEKTTGLLTS